MNKIFKFGLAFFAMLLMAAPAVSADLNSELIDSMQYVGNDAKIKKLLDDGANPNAVDTEGNPVIVYAIDNGRYKMVELLLEKGANIEAVFDEYKTTPLIYAAEVGEKDIVELLLNKGANIEAKNSYGNTALNRASTYGEKDTVELLLKKGAKVNVADKDGDTALLSALQYILENTDDDRKVTKEVVELLLAKGADVNVKNKEGETPLYYAIVNGHTADVGTLLINKGANIDAFTKDGDSLLKKALSYNNKDMAKLLISKGANVNANPEILVTAVYTDIDTLKMLIDKGAKVNLPDGNTSALHIAAFNGNLDMAKLLVERGANVNARNEDKRTPLHQAVESGQLDVVEFLVSKGANVNAVSNTYITPFVLAAVGGDSNLPIMKFLLSKGAKVSTGGKYMGGVTDIPSKEESLLHTLAREKQAEAMKLVVDNLAKNDPELNAIWGYGTPVLISVARNMAEPAKNYSSSRKSDSITVPRKDILYIVEALIKKGTNPNVKDETGRTAYDYAAKDVQELLKKYGGKSGRQ